jgi:hypothetical protein
VTEVRGARYFCRVGAAVLAAAYAQDGVSPHVICPLTPGLVPGVNNVAISFNGQQYAPITREFLVFGG